MSLRLRVHDICPYSRVNGPGVRAVLWVQGCSIGCKGCFNPDTHPENQNGTDYDPKRLGEELGKLAVDGVTVSGGEPLDQPEPLVAMMQAFRQSHGGTALLYTGYTVDSILRCDRKRKALLQFDAAIAGPYQYHSNEIWQGKKLVLLTARITADELQPERKIEFVGRENSLHVTGFPTAQIKTLVQSML
ncbi:4Fe-4S single cluster domain-containing protein [Brevibacillus reuszeri]|uniref:4Fe-4S single cluster domain-containing protein n=1 Tax=Brevibacillus reuszeri TaxID=54915 RepID=UPI000CCBE34E|nr:4Fe-4S single cluster domain-containing protein [Brevibacillus reuszeri]